MDKIVIIAVKGGVGYDVYIPENIKCYIIDYDNLPNDTYCQICGTQLEDIHDYNTEEGHILLSRHYCPTCDKDWEVDDPVKYLIDKG